MCLLSLQLCGEERGLFTRFGAADDVAFSVSTQLKAREPLMPASSRPSIVMALGNHVQVSRTAMMGGVQVLLIVSRIHPFVVCFLQLEKIMAEIKNRAPSPDEEEAFLDDYLANCIVVLDEVHELFVLCEGEKKVCQLHQPPSPPQILPDL